MTNCPSAKHPTPQPPPLDLDPLTLTLSGERVAAAAEEEGAHLISHGVQAFFPAESVCERELQWIHGSMHSPHFSLFSITPYHA